MKLADQQAALAKWVLDAKAQGTPKGLAPLKDLDAGAGANLYRDAILEVEIRALIITFPIVYDLVGDRYFRAAAKQYLRGEDSRFRDGNLDKIGNGFPAILPTLEAAEQTPYLADVARMELAIDRASGGLDAAPLDQETLTALSNDPSDLQCRLCPNATILQSQYPIDKIHASWLEGFKEELDISNDSGTTSIIVWRPEDEAKVSRLSIDEWTLLSAISTHHSFLKAVESASDQNPQIDVASALANAIPSRWVEITVNS